MRENDENSFLLFCWWIFLFLMIFVVFLYSVPGVESVDVKIQLSYFILVWYESRIIFIDLLAHVCCVILFLMWPIYTRIYTEPMSWRIVIFVARTFAITTTEKKNSTRFIFCAQSNFNSNPFIPVHLLLLLLSLLIFTQSINFPSGCEVICETVRMMILRCDIFMWIDLSIRCLHRQNTFSYSMDDIKM